MCNEGKGLQITVKGLLCESSKAAQSLSCIAGLILLAVPDLDDLMKRLDQVCLWHGYIVHVLV